MLERRSIDIMETILGNPKITIKELELRTSLTRRKIAYDLEKINYWLKTNNLQEIKKDQQKGLSFPGDANEILSILEKKDIKGTLNEEERKRIIFFYLFMQNEEISLLHLIDVVDVSRGTVNDDLKKLSANLKEYFLEISYSRKNGYYINGNEQDIRNVLIMFIVEIIFKGTNRELLDFVLDEEIFEEITCVCSRYFQEHQIILSDNNFLEICYIIAFVFIRKNNTQKWIEMDNQFEFHRYDEYKIAREILSNLNFIHESQEDYAAFLTSLMLSFSSVQISQKTNDYYLLKDFLFEIITKLETTYGIDIGDKESAFKQIYYHLRPAYYRILFQYPIINPLKRKIQEQYSFLFKILKDLFESSYLPNGKMVSDDEIAYLTIHFATLMKDKKTKKIYAYTAAVVCPNGTGLSLILYNELTNLFPEIKFLQPFSLNELETISDNVDVIFSTRLIKSSKPVFIASPVMTDIEKENLVKNFYRWSNKSVCIDNSSIVKELTKIISNYSEIKDPLNLNKALSNITANYLIFDKKRRLPMLSDIMTEPLIQLNIEATDWRDAIRKGGELLIANNKASANYVQAMIDSAEGNGSYIVITKNVALPHARPEEGVKDLAISMITLSKPIKFGNKENDPVKYVFCLCAVDNSTHLRAMSNLVQLLDKKEFYSKLDRSVDSKEVVDFIKKCEKELEM